MSYASQESISVTLTQAELAAPFLDAGPDGDPLPERTRLPVLWDGMDWVEVDTRTGRHLDRGRQ